MRASEIVVGFVLPLVASAQGHGRRDITDPIPYGVGPIAGSFIVEYAPGKNLNDRIPSTDISVLKTYDNKVFSGASIHTETFTRENLEALPEVLHVWPDYKLQLDQIVRTTPNTSADTYTWHNATGVSKLHDQGIFGQGVIVGMVDTGIWYEHEALGGGFGPGFKVAKGRDFVGDGTWPDKGKRTPDNDPKDQLGHGTHTAGIVAGKSADWSGVAPNATLYAYKVSSQAGQTPVSVLIEAFLAAYDDGVDIISSSFTSTIGWSDDVWAVVASRLVDEGVLVTIPEGNKGSNGPFYASAGSAGSNVLAVASVDGESHAPAPFNLTFSRHGNTSATSTTAGYLSAGEYFSNTTHLPIRALSLDTNATAEACDPLPVGTPSFRGTIALVRRGNCTFATQQAHLEVHGAMHILIYNNEELPVWPQANNNRSSLMGLITAETGATIISAIKAGGNVTADFTLSLASPLVSIPDVMTGRPSTFTTWGALYDLQIKPDIAAPGSNIFSTWPGNEYAVLSGTSMSSPYVAGVAALYISVHGGRKVHGRDFAKNLAKRLIATGSSLPWSDGTLKDFGYYASVAQVGGGLIDAFKAVNYTTTLFYEKFALNDTTRFSSNHSVVVSNNATTNVTYLVSNQPAAGVEILGHYALLASDDDPRIKSFNDLTPRALSVDADVPGSFTLQPGETKNVSVVFHSPEGQAWNASRLPVYSGKIVLSGSNGERLSIPYLGLAADLKKELTPIYRPTYPFSRSSTKLTDIHKKAYYTFDLANITQDFPKIYSATKWGSREVRWDIFEPTWKESDWVYPPVVGKHGYIGPATCWHGAGEFTSFDDQTQDPNSTWTYPAVDVPRDYQEYWWFGKLGNGSQIELGNYTIRFATLLPFGDPTKSDDWSVFQIPQIEVRGKYKVAKKD